MKTVVIIPTYNEIENISAIIKSVFAQKEDLHILVVDDGSPDGTAEVVKKLMESNPERLFIHERSGKLALGQHISLDSAGLLSIPMTFVLKWMQTSVIIPTISEGY